MTTLQERRYLPIYNAIEELNKRGTFPSYRRKDLEDRLVIACKDLGRQPRSEVPRERKQILANSRENKAHRIYLEVLDENCHAFLPFILAISPRACVSFNLGGFLRYQTDHRCRLHLTIEAKRLLDGIARRRGFIQSPHYEKFTRAVFPEEDGGTKPVSGVAGQQSLETAAADSTQTELHVVDSVRVPQQSDAAPAGIATSLLRAIRFEKHTLQRIVLERPTDILGGIWFGSPQGYPPCVLLRLPRALDFIVKPSGQEVYVPGPSPGATSTATRIYLIKLECFKQMIQRDGFGVIFWNECGEEAFVTMEVIDAGLAEDFIRGAVPD